ncbi:MAG TPA: serine/threonine-protein kinase, partial [Jatrophihabitans sp.]
MDNEPEATQRPSERPGGAISEDTGALGPETQPIPSQPPSKPAWVLGGRYRVIDRIGAGGMAEVFRAHDELLARDVAVKVFRTVPVAPDTASGAERQMIELRALAALNHPNLITLFDGSVTGNDGPAFLVMELIDGPSLAARIDDGALPEHEAREVGIQIADALAYVHAQGMVHRDVKPANILLGHDRTVADSTFRARLSDFGIVRLLGNERLTSVNFTLGTASYLAPEQARGSDVGPVADVYSLGLVLIESLTGVRSFAGPPLEAVMARLERSPDIPAHLAPPWPALLSAMTSSDPAARPTAGQVAQTLQDGRSASIPLPAAGAIFPAEAETVGIAAVGGAAALAAAGGAEALSPIETDPWAPADDHPRRRWMALLLVAGLLA